MLRLLALETVLETVELMPVVMGVVSGPESIVLLGMIGLCPARLELPLHLVPLNPRLLLAPVPLDHLDREAPILVLVQLQAWGSTRSDLSHP